MITRLEGWLATEITLADALPILLLVILTVLAATMAARFRGTTEAQGGPLAPTPLARAEAWLERAGIGPFWRIMFWLTVVAFFGLFLIAIAAAYVLVTNVLTSDGGTASLGLGALLVALLGAPFLIWRSVVAQRTLDTTRDGLVTDRINAAVVSLGAEKEVNRIGRSIRYRLGDIWHTEFEWQDERFTYPDDAIFRKDDPPSEWQNIGVTLPNMEVRVGAIHALGRIARENLGFHVQIMEILCAYVRENSPADDAVKFKMPEEDEAWNDDVEAAKAAVQEGLGKLPKPRTDIQTALEVLGRRTPNQKRREGGWPDPDRDGPCIFDQPFPSPPSYPQTDSAPAHKAWRSQFAGFRKAADALCEKFQTQRTYRHDLRNSNLQGYDLSNLDLRGANLAGAKMQGATLVGAKMQGAVLREAQMQGADLGRTEMQAADLFTAQMQEAKVFWAQMQGADLLGAQMQGAILFGAQMQGARLFTAQIQGAVLHGAQMQGADLREAQMSKDTNIWGAILRGASLVFVDETTIARVRPHWDDVIAFLETLPEGAPDHWVRVAREDFDFDAYLIQWRAFAATLDPPVTIQPEYYLS
jgi:uncharacterized protein YjbI with pentapeptide repeats